MNAIPALTAATLVAGASALPATAAGLQPFTATYDVSWHGITAGSVTYRLEQLGDGRWSYSSQSTPRGMARMFLPEKITQRSVMQIGAQGVQPLNFDTDDGTQAGRRSTHLAFDWPGLRVRGSDEQQKVDLELRAGVQDDLSVQVALMSALQAGEQPDGFAVAGKDGVRSYRYAHERGAQLDTALGSIATQVYVSQREGSPRQTRFWCAPSLGYLPVRAEQRRGDSVEWTMVITAAQRSAQ